MKSVVIKTGGKQYLVTSGEKLRVEKIDGEVGANVDFDALLISDDDKVKVGTPIVSGAKISATISGQGRGRKIIVQKYKPKVRYRKKMGHRQFYTEITIGQV